MTITLKWKYKYIIASPKGTEIIVREKSVGKDLLKI